MDAWAFPQNVDEMGFDALSSIDDLLDSHLDAVTFSSACISMAGKGVDFNPCCRILFTAETMRSGESVNPKRNHAVYGELEADTRMLFLLCFG
jgi:hypothetical protein